MLGPEVHASVTFVGFTNDPHSLICRKATRFRLVSPWHATRPAVDSSVLGQPGLKMRTGSYGVPAAREMSRAMVYGNKKLVVLYTASNALRLLASSQSLRLRAPAPRAEGRSQSAINHRRAAQVVCSSSGGIRVVEQPAAERWQIELNCIHMGTQLCRGTAGRFT